MKQGYQQRPPSRCRASTLYYRPPSHAHTHLRHPHVVAALPDQQRRADAVRVEHRAQAPVEARVPGHVAHPKQPAVLDGLPVGRHGPSEVCEVCDAAERDAAAVQLRRESQACSSMVRIWQQAGGRLSGSGWCLSERSQGLAGGTPQTCSRRAKARTAIVLTFCVCDTDAAGASNCRNHFRMWWQQGQVYVLTRHTADCRSPKHRHSCRRAALTCKGGIAPIA